MKKKIVLTLLATVCALSCALFGLAACNTGDENGLEYALNADGESYMVIRLLDAKSDDLVIPSEYKGKPVTSISTRAFHEPNIKSVTIPETVTEIGLYAFRGCTSLEKLTVDSANKTFRSEGNCVIEKKSKTLRLGCKNSVIPDDGSVTSIGYGAFWYFDLDELTLPSSITSIKELAFFNATIDKLIIENGDASADIASYPSFKSCSIKSVKVPANALNYMITSLEGDNGAQIRSSLKNVEITGGIIGGKNVLKDITSVESVTVSGTITSVGNEAFSGCTSLKSFTLSSAVTSIGDSVLSGCAALTDVNFDGTTDEWVAITKGNDWDNGTGDYTVRCTDGQVAKDGTVTKN